MIYFKKEAVDSIDTVLLKLGVQDRGVGWVADITTGDEVIFAEIIGPADEEWLETHSEFDADLVDECLASWPVMIRRLNEHGEPYGEREIVIATRIAIL